MKKFLALVEELDPTNSNDPKWELSDFLKSKGVDVVVEKAEGGLSIMVEGKKVKLKVANNEEDAESLDAGYGDYNVNQEVEGLADKAQSGMKGLAGKIFGSDAQKAAGAIKKRQQVARQAVGVYDKKTQQLKKDLANV